ncbi:hypothetical protein PISMIDRAFT_123996, partial [Pisolithus microcarpus 441]
LRVGHAFLGEYYSLFVPTEDRSCPCGEPVQTREHVITSCLAFDNNRNVLCTASKDLILLGTE